MTSFTNVLNTFLAVHTLRGHFANILGMLLLNVLWNKKWQLKTEQKTFN